MPSNSIIVGGKRHPLGLPNEPPPIVLTWHDHGISFAPGEGHNKKRRAQIDLAVWHWTGGEGEPAQMADTLKARGYGVEFAIARTGIIWQFVDPLLVDTADAGGVNARSVGTEIVNYGMRGNTPNWVPPQAGKDRPRRDVLIHGNKMTVADFFPAQIVAARALADGLSRSLGIPRRVPLSRDNIVFARALNVVDLSRFTGHAGHYHLTRDKCDPGPAFMMELQRLFATTTDSSGAAA